jgi:hypothetical protein
MLSRFNQKYLKYKIKYNSIIKEKVFNSYKNINNIINILNNEYKINKLNQIGGSKNRMIKNSKTIILFYRNMVEEYYFINFQLHSQYNKLLKKLKQKNNVFFNSIASILEETINNNISFNIEIDFNTIKKGGANDYEDDEDFKALGNKIKLAMETVKEYNFLKNLFDPLFVKLDKIIDDVAKLKNLSDIINKIDTEIDNNTADPVQILSIINEIIEKIKNETPDRIVTILQDLETLSEHFIEIPDNLAHKQEYYDILERKIEEIYKYKMDELKAKETDKNYEIKNMIKALEETHASRGTNKLGKKIKKIKNLFIKFDEKLDKFGIDIIKNNEESVALITELERDTLLNLLEKNIKILEKIKISKTMFDTKDHIKAEIDSLKLLLSNSKNSTNTVEIKDIEDMYPVIDEKIRQIELKSTETNTLYDKYEEENKKYKEIDVIILPIIKVINDDKQIIDTKIVEINQDIITLKSYQLKIEEIIRNVQNIDRFDSTIRDDEKLRLINIDLLDVEKINLDSTTLIKSVLDDKIKAIKDNKTQIETKLTEITNTYQNPSFSANEQYEKYIKYHHDIKEKEIIDIKIDEKIDKFNEDITPIDTFIKIDHIQIIRDKIVEYTLDKEFNDIEKSMDENIIKINKNKEEFDILYIKIKEHNTEINLKIQTFESNQTKTIVLGQTLLAEIIQKLTEFTSDKIKNDEYNVYIISDIQKCKELKILSETKNNGVSNQKITNIVSKFTEIELLITNYETQRKIDEIIQIIADLNIKKGNIEEIIKDIEIINKATEFERLYNEIKPKIEQEKRIITGLLLTCKQKTSSINFNEFEKLEDALSFTIDDPDKFKKYNQYLKLLNSVTGLPADHNDTIINGEKIKLEEIKTDIDRLSSTDKNKQLLSIILVNVTELIKEIDDLKLIIKEIHDIKTRYEKYKEKYEKEIDKFEKSIILIIKAFDTKFNLHYKPINDEADKNIKEMESKITKPEIDKNKTIKEILLEAGPDKDYSKFILKYNDEFKEDSPINLEKIEFINKIKKLYDLENKITDKIMNELDIIGKENKVLFETNKIKLNELVIELENKNKVSNEELLEIKYFIKSLNGEKGLNKENENIHTYYNNIKIILKLGFPKPTPELSNDTTTQDIMENIIKIIYYLFKKNIRSENIKNKIFKNQDEPPINYEKYFQTNNEYNLKIDSFFKFNYKNNADENLFDSYLKNFKFDKQNFKFKYANFILNELKYEEIQILQKFTYNLLIIFDKYKDYFKAKNDYLAKLSN